MTAAVIRFLDMGSDVYMNCDDVYGVSNGKDFVNFFQNEHEAQDFASTDYGYYHWVYLKTWYLFCPDNENVYIAGDTSDVPIGKVDQMPWVSWYYIE